MARVAIGFHELGSEEEGVHFVVSEMKKLKNHSVSVRCRSDRG